MGVPGASAEGTIPTITNTKAPYSDIAVYTANIRQLWVVI